MTTVLLLTALMHIAAQSHDMASVRSDDGRRAVFEYQYGGNRDIPHFGGVIYLSPKGSWPRQKNYDIWLVRFDCTERTRTTTARITYSSWRDPQTVPTTPHRVDDESNPAVADQLALICDRQSEGRATYRTLDDFLMDRPLP